MAIPLMTVENVRTAINILEAIDPKDEYAYEQALLAYLTVRQLPTFLFDVPANMEVFRTRTSFDNEIFDTVKDISLPPIELIKSFARCNRPFQSKFYCSENRPTSYMELVEYWSDNREVGEKLSVTIGRWRVKRSFSTLLITSPYAEQRTSPFDIEHGEVLDELLSEYEGEFLQANILIYDYLFQKFRKSAKNDMHTYLVTSAYCNIALSRVKHDIDAIYYPSVPFGGQGVNFAFNHKFVCPENMELVDAIWDEFTVYINEEEKKSFHQTRNLYTSKIDLQLGRINW